MEISLQKPLRITKKLLFPNHLIFQQLSTNNLFNTYKCYSKLTKKVSIIRIIDIQSEINEISETTISPLVNELLPVLNFKICNLKTIIGYNIGQLDDVGVYNSCFYYCSEFVNGETLECYVKKILKKKMDLNILCFKLLTFYKGLHIYNIPFPYIESSSLILKNNKIMLFANFNPKYFFIKYTFPLCYVEKFIACREDRKYFINLQINTKIALFCASKILYQFAEINFKTKELKQNLAIYLSRKFKKKFSRFLGFYFFFGKGLKKPNKFKYNKLEILILRKRAEIFKNWHYFHDPILPRLIIKIVQLFKKTLISILIIISFLVLTNFFLKTTKSEIRINNSDLCIINRKKPHTMTKNWSSTSTNWMIGNGEINFVYQSEKYTTMTHDFSFFIENVEKYKEIAGIVNLKETAFLNDILKARIDRITREKLNSQFYNDKNGGIFFLSSEKNRAIGIIIKLSNQCQVVELKKKLKGFQVESFYEIPCDSENARVSLRINPKRNLVYGIIGDTKFSIKPKTKIKNFIWRRAFGCCNVNCSFKPKL